MQKITFENLPSTDTPLSAANLNELQDNVEDAIDEAGVVVSPTEPTTDRKKVWLQKGKNLFNGNALGAITSVGVTATPTGSKIKLNGTTTTAGGIYTTQYLCNLKAGKYKLSYSIESGTVSTAGYAILLRKSNGDSLDPVNDVYTLATDQAVYFRIYVNASGIVFNNLVLKLQLEKGEEATEYEDYVEDKTFILNDNVYEEYEPINDDVKNFMDKYKISTTTFNLISGYSFSNQYISSPYVRKIGDIVELNMIINCANNVPSTDVQIGVLPSGFRPKYTQFDICGLGTSDGYGWTYSAVGIVVVETGGGIRIRNIQGTYRYALINIKYIAA